MRPDRERARPDERGAGSKSWAGGPDTTDRTATLDTVPAWPPCEGTAAEPVTYDELRRRRRAYFQLQEFLGLRGAA